MAPKRAKGAAPKPCQLLVDSVGKDIAAIEKYLETCDATVRKNAFSAMNAVTSKEQKDAHTFYKGITDVAVQRHWLAVFSRH